MCLEVIDSRYKTNKLKKSLPKWFPVWKIVRRNGKPQYGGECLKKGKVHIAKKAPSRRMQITYRPGFHAFVNKKEALVASKLNNSSSSWRPGGILREYWSRPEWITKSGYSDTTYANARTVVLKKIRRK